MTTTAIENVQAFLDELSALTIKYRLQIGGCGCCGSPDLSEIAASEVIPADARYTVNGHYEHLRFHMQLPNKADAKDVRGESAVKNEPYLTIAEGKPFGATWLITAAWAHTVWSQYALLLYDLTTPTEPPPQVYLDGATHEVLLFALDPAHPVENAKALIEQRQFRPLDPPNHGYQFTAKDDVAAVSRLQLIVAEIEAQRLSPDTDFRAACDSFFRDAHSLRR